MLKNKKLQKYLIKNRILSLLFAVVMLAVIIFSAKYFKLSTKLDYRQCMNIAQVEETYKAGSSYVDFTIDRADYLGYESYSGASLDGRYYYSKQDGRYIILLLNSKDDILLDYSVRGKLISKDSEINTILQGLSSDSGLSRTQLEDMTYDFILSEKDYPTTYYLLVVVVLVLGIIWMLSALIYFADSFLRPWKTATVRSITGRPANKETVKDINKELRHNVYYSRDPVTITESYLVFHDMFHTEVLVLDHIEQVKKTRATSRLILSRAVVHRLIMIDSEGTTYEQDFYKKSVMDEVASYLIEEEEIN